MDHGTAALSQDSASVGQVPSANESPINRLRALRRKAQEIHASVVEDLAAFKQKNGTFRRLPGDPKGNLISVTTTCSVLMTLVEGNQLDRVYGKSFVPNILSVMKRVCRARWASSGLDPDNAFTKSFVLRTAGFLKSHSGIDTDSLRHGKRSLGGIAKSLAQGIPKSLSVQKYPAKPAIGYWFVDGVDNLRISMDEAVWQKLADWTAREFENQLSYVVSANDALMDPVSMIMAACLAQRVRRAPTIEKFSARITNRLPSAVELNCAISELFKRQAPSGIWPKYFPLFHFKEAGANHCFSAELLEAVLNEFGSLPFLSNQSTLAGLERAVDWCDSNRRTYHLRNEKYEGWHSGGEVSTLKEGQPESWATAMVHLFLSRLCRILSEAIRKLVLERYRESAARAPGVDWDHMLDMDVKIQGKRTTAKMVLKKEIINALKKTASEKRPITSRRSALLFGPPGTSKTTLASLVAKELGWDLVEINPSHFLSMGLEKIYIRADEIFEDLMDLYRAVILFDEMDALVRSRQDQGAAHLDVTSQFLTTSMLPKLAKLHDEANVVFFMATNHRRSFDTAILRPGRFDILLWIPPPSWKRKLEKIDAILKLDEKAENIERVRRTLTKWTRKEKKHSELLDRFTFDEFRSFLRERIWADKNETFTVNIQGIQQRAFLESVEEWASNFIVLREKPTAIASASNDYEEYKDDRNCSLRQ